MTPSGVVTLLTDFGTSDPFVGVMKGVILSRFAAARIVDLTHGIPAQDLAAAAFWLERSYRWFPPGSVHVVVVDPGVGSERAAIAARADDHFFVAPDNGVLGGVLAATPDAEIRVIDLALLALPAPSRTFHGRDVFAPAAADLASGRVGLDSVGAPPAQVAELTLPRAARDASGVVGHVVVVDHFGNLITNIEPALFADFAKPRLRLGDRDVPIAGTYAEARRGELCGVVNSFGTLEIARRDGSAATVLGAGPGAAVRVVDAK